MTDTSSPPMTHSRLNTRAPAGRIFAPPAIWAPYPAPGVDLSCRHILVNGRLGMPAHAVGQDRMADAAIPGGDLRLTCDLFGRTIATAPHHTSVLSHPALDTETAAPPT